MADKMIFPIGFDLEAGVKQAGADWESKWASQLEKKIQARPLKVALKLDEKGLANLDDVKKRLAEVKLEPLTAETKTAIRDLARELQQLAKALEMVQKYSASRGKVTPDAVRAQRVSAIQQGADDKSAIAYQKAREAAAKAEIAEERLTKARERATRAGVSGAQQVTREYRTHEGYLNRLAQRMAMYASVQQVGNFLMQIKEVTAQFELQRISLGAIIQDQTRANQLFQEIKSFAVQSPVSIMDLTKTTKQLAAYSIETDKLFDTAMRLTDVSVGLGADISRLVLAFGETKATNVMNAKELRQFAMMGIPMLELLSEKLSEIKGKAISTSETFEMIKKRLVHFDVVEEVFKDLTSEGGMFYDMQIKQGNTLYGMWAKLGDAVSVMYDQIGNTEGAAGGMRWIINGLTDMARNWQAVAKTIGVVAGFAGTMFVGNKIAAFVKSDSAFREAAYARQAQAAKAVAVAEKQLTAAKEAGNIAEKRRLDLVYARTQKELQAANDAVGKNFFGAEKISLFGRALSFVGNAIRGIAGTALIMWLIQATYNFYKSATAASALKKQLDEIREKGKLDSDNSVANFISLANAAANYSNGITEQRRALEELKRTYSGMISTQDLTIEKLAAMKGNYDALTNAIREYMAQQTLQNQVDEIKNTLGKNMEDARKKLENWFKDGNLTINFGEGDKRIIGVEQGRRIMRNITLGIQQEGKNQFDAINDAFKLEGIYLSSDVINNWLKESVIHDYTRSLWDMQQAINGVSDTTKEELGVLGQYSKFWEEYQKGMEKWEDAITNRNKDTLADKGTYLYSRQRDNEDIKGMVHVLQQGMGDAWKDEMADLVIDITDETQRLTTLQWDKIEEAASNSSDEALKKLVGKVRKHYDELIPSDEIIQGINNRIMQIAEGSNAGMDFMRRFLMQGGDDVKKATKDAEDNLEELQNALIRMTQLNFLSMTSFGAAKIAEVKEQIELTKQVVAFYKSLSIEKDKGRKSDTRLQNLKEEISLVQKLYNEYKQLEKQEGSTKAFRDMQAMAGDTIAMLGKKYGIGLPQNVTSLTAALEILYDEMEKLSKVKGAKKLFPSIKKDLEELRWTIEKANIDGVQKALEDKLKDLADRVSRSKTAKDFYDKILGLTGDKTLAANFAVNVYGGIGKDLTANIKSQIEEAIKQGSMEGKVDLGQFIRYDGSVDSVKLREWALANKDALAGGFDILIKIADEGSKDLASAMERWIKATEKSKTYTDKVMDLRRKTQEEMDAIGRQKGYANTELSGLLGIAAPTDAEKARIEELVSLLEQLDELSVGYMRKEGEELAKLQYEAFKDSPMYVQVFDDLDNASGAALRNMRDRLEGLQKEWKNLDPKQLKEMQSRLNEIDKQLAKRNPFKGLADGLREYRKLRKGGKREDADNALAKAAKERKEAEKEYLDLLNKEGADSTLTKEAKGLLDKAIENEDAAAKLVERWKKVKDQIGLSVDELFTMLNWAGDLAKGVAEIGEVLGVDAEDVQYWNDIAEAMGNVASGIEDIVKASMSGNVVGIISSVITAIPKMFTGFANLFSANKVRKANKEIKAQENALKRLEYAYSRLEKMAEKVFGGQWIANQRKQIDTLRAEAEAYQKQMNAEKSKGKKADKDKIAEYEAKWKETLDKIADRAGEVFEKMMGSNMASAAREFAQSWLEAYKEFGRTTDKMSEKFHEMVENMIVESLLARVMEAALRPAFEMIDQASEQDFYDPNYWSRVMDVANKGMKAGDAGAKAVMSFLQSAGIELRSLGGELSGISKEIGGATSEEVNAQTAALNTQNYYASKTSDDVAAIRARIFDGDNAANDAPDWKPWMSDAMDNLRAIERNTAETAAECKRSAAAAEATLAEVKRVIKYEGGTAKLNVKL